MPGLAPDVIDWGAVQKVEATAIPQSSEFPCHDLIVPRAHMQLHFSSIIKEFVNLSYHQRLQITKIAFFAVFSSLVTALIPTQIEIMKAEARAMNCPWYLAGWCCWAGAATQSQLGSARLCLPASTQPGQLHYLPMQTQEDFSNALWKWAHENGMLTYKYYRDFCLIILSQSASVCFALDALGF